MIGRLDLAKLLWGFCRISNTFVMNSGEPDIIVTPGTLENLDLVLDVVLDRDVHGKSPIYGWGVMQSLQIAASLNQGLNHKTKYL